MSAGAIEIGSLDILARPRRMLLAMVPALAIPSGVAGRGAGGDAVTARALAGAGIAGLLGLPLLMVASLLAHAPFAAPAAISLGFLGAAQALASGRADRAAMWSFAVFFALVGWTLLSFAMNAATISPAWLATALLAPLFAAAPALARCLVGRGDDPQRMAARGDAACLQRLAPSEAVLILDRAGTLLAGTDAGLAALGLGREDFGRDLTRRFHLLDAPMLLAALDRSAEAAARDLLLRMGGRGGTTWLSVSLAAGPRDTVSMRVAAPRPAAALPETATRAPKSDGIAPRPCDAACDLGEAVSFAFRQCGERAAERGLTLSSESAAPMQAACDRQVGRRLLQAALEAVLASSEPGGDIRVATRSLKGAVLVRIASDDASGTHGPAAGFAAARLIAERAGGTLVAERSGSMLVVSIRLAPVAAKGETPTASKRGGAD